MATFNFHDKVEAQNIAGHDIFVGSDPGRTRAIEALTDLLTAAREAIASGSMAHDAGDQATAEISTAITALAVPDPEASPRRTTGAGSHDTGAGSHDTEQASDEQS